jgi:hypothetical protein
MLSVSFGKSLVSKDSEADGSHGSGTKTLYSNCWCDEKLESIPHKNSTAESPQTIRIGTPQEFFTIDFWVNYRRTIALFTLYNFG